MRVVEVYAPTVPELPGIVRAEWRKIRGGGIGRAIGTLRHCEMKLIAGLFTREVFRNEAALGAAAIRALIPHHPALKRRDDLLRLHGPKHFAGRCPNIFVIALMARGAVVFEQGRTEIAADGSRTLRAKLLRRHDNNDC